MADTLTAVLQLTKPEVGGSVDTWGTKFNANLDLIDAIFAAAGGGTSVGLQVGAGKTLKIGGTLSMLAGAIISIDSSIAAPWVKSADVSTSGGANKIPKLDASGHLGLYAATAGTWDSGGGASVVTPGGNPPLVTLRPTFATEYPSGSVFGGDDFIGFCYNTHWTGGSLGSFKNKVTGRAWTIGASPLYFFGAATTGPDNVAAGQPSNMGYAFTFDRIGTLHNYATYGISDLREKRNLHRIDEPLERLRQITGYTYEMLRTGEERHAGVIAQELRNVLPEAVRQGPGEGGRLAVNSAAVIGLLVEAIKALDLKVSSMEGALWPN